MTKELAKTLTTALVQFIDRERPEGTMCCSNTECKSIEEMFEGECFDIIEAFIQKKLSGLTEFEKVFIERVFHQKIEDLDEENKEIFREDAHIVLDLVREQLIKDGYVIEKKAFHDAVAKVDPEAMKEVSDNVDKANEEKPTEFEKFMDKVVDDAIRETYSKDGFYDICRDALALAEKEITKGHEHDVYIPEDTYYEQLKKQWEEGYDKGKVEALKDLPRWEDIRNFAYSWTSEGKPFYDDTLGQLFHKGKRLFIGDLEKLPGFKEDKI